MLKINTVTMEKQIKEILVKFHNDGDYLLKDATKELLNLFDVNGCFNIYMDIYADESEAVVGIFDEENKVVFNCIDKFDEVVKEMRNKIIELNNR